MGIIYSITGPTLPVLAEHLCQTPDTVGWILGSVFLFYITLFASQYFKKPTVSWSISGSSHRKFARTDGRQNGQA
jgi:hypothetical protein